ncbi:MAG: HAMP domain-containing histidine kinase, partial [Chitinophagaceae bacterium]
DAFFTQALTKTEKQAKSMKRMIEDFLIISRLEEAKLQLNPETFELHLLLQELIQDFQLIHGHHDLHFSHDGQVYLHADRSKIAHVMVNLIGNAIKYGPKKSKITIGYRTQGSEVKIYVEDKGIGISEADQKHLFERFYRVQTEKTKHITGFGIGLYLASEILRYHNSDICVQSSIGKGSTFYFMLPIDEHRDEG